MISVNKKNKFWTFQQASPCLLTPDTKKSKQLYRLWEWPVWQ